MKKSGFVSDQALIWLVPPISKPSSSFHPSGLSFSRFLIHDFSVVT